MPILRTYWKPDHTRYVEPFAGSACLFFSLDPNRAILGDLNADLISTYIEIKYRVDGVLKALSKFRRSKRQYMELRAVDTAKLSRSFRAARFMFLNRFCFNGLYRTNRLGRFNVPYGAQKSGNFHFDISQNVFAEVEKYETSYR